jgi:hypothetical protein
MIWFNCKKCNKPHSRPDSQAGTMIFCDCGQGLTIPWESTALPARPTAETVPTHVDDDDDEEDLPEAIPVPRPRAVPIPVADDDQPARRPSQTLPPTPPTGDSLPQKKRRTIKRTNPAYCFNHEEAASETVCDDCKLSFCNACVVDFQGYTLCSPCKNFRLRDRAVPTRVSPWAVVALVAGFASGPVGFCISALPLTLHLQAHGSPGLTVAAVLLALVPAALACWLGIRALRQLDREPLLSGRGLAMTGTLAGVLGGLWSITIGVLTIAKQISTGGG